MNGDTIKGLVSIFLAAILTENYILSKFLGICPFLGVSKKLNTAASMSMAVTLVMVIATAVTWPIYYGILVPNDLAYLQTIVFILIIAALVQLIEIVLKRYMPPLYNALGIYLPLITTNCAILGAANSAIVYQSYDFLYTFGFSVATGVGFLLAIVLLAGVRLKTDKADIPKCFKGFPITLITAAIMAMAFAGFAGILAG